MGHLEIMSPPGPSLYDLLPAYVRFRDAYEGEPLRAVMETLQLPFERIRADIDALYAAWFIETCDDWMVPYIGELLGVRGFESPRQLFPTGRSRVGNAIAYRRSKGTPAALERAAHDVTGWPCHLVESRRALSATPSVVEAPGGAPFTAATVDLRRADDLDRLGGPFDALPHTADFKPSPSGDPRGGGGYQLLQLGLAFWRLESYPVTGVTPAEIAGSCYAFHPFGLDAPLFNAPQTAGEPVYSSAERNLPIVLRRLPLAEEIAARRAGRLPATGFFAGEPAFQIALAEGADPTLRPLAPEELAICDLADWEPREAGGATPQGEAAVRAFVDPRRGRFVIPGGAERRVRVSYSYGAAMDLGGGPYSRRGRPADLPAAGWRAVVGEGCERRFDPRSRRHFFPSLRAALEAWNQGRPLPIPPSGRAEILPPSGVIEICDSASYPGDLAVDLRGRRLAIVAADGCRPCVLGSLTVRGRPLPAGGIAAIADAEALIPVAAQPAELRLDGLWMQGGIDLAGGGLLVLEHCTIAPPHPGRGEACAVRIAGGAERTGDGTRRAPERFAIRARRCILGALELGTQRGRLSLADCIVDGAGGAAVAAFQTVADLARCTVLGGVEAGQLAAVDVLFAAAVRVAVTSEGEVRYCYLPAGSRVPAQERCQGEGALGATRIEAPVTPAFTATAFGDPAYLQLGPTASPELLRGAEDGNEIGAYNRLRQSDRLANLPRVRDEFMPWGMDLRVSFVT
jgi:hypothetical protein